MSSVRAALATITHELPGGGEERPGQISMAEQVEATMRRSGTLVVEAGTGTGKSLAYLVPAALGGARTVVATATIALQGQLLHHDIPLVAEGLGLDLRAVIVKGRRNYLCVQRLDELDRADADEQLELLGTRSLGDELAELRSWAETTETGDREELDPAPRADLWAAVSVGVDECPGATRCPSGDRCHAERAREAAREADIVVTNHHYYGLHLATDNALLPDHELVVFDEAHHLPEVIGATCGTEVDANRLRNLARRVRGVLTDDGPPTALDRSALDLEVILDGLRGERIRHHADLVAALTMARARVDDALAALRRVPAKDDTDVGARVERAVLAASSLADDIDRIVQAGDDDVLWVDGGPRRASLRRTPLEVGEILEATLWGERAGVLTSATIPDAFVEQVGLPPDCTVERVGSPFDYATQGLLYCNPDLPNPNHETARAAVHDEMTALIEAAGGRTLGLFTSFSAMQEAAEVLRDRLDVPVACQGDNAKAALIRDFRSDPAAVLLATMSFWQGVDLPGDTLTLVTIDRLPFPRPDEPVTQARRERARAAAFRTVDLPRVQTLLAQAAGRLIRRADDRGVVAVFDPRLATNKSYRWEVVHSLPPFQRTRHRHEAVAFLEAIRDGAEG